MKLLNGIYYYVRIVCREVAKSDYWQLIVTDPDKLLEEVETSKSEEELAFDNQHLVV